MTMADLIRRLEQAAEKYGEEAEVAAELTARGVPTRRGKKWTPGLVHHLLKPDR